MTPHPGPSSTSASTTPTAIANAGLLLAATLAERLSMEQTADALIDLGEEAGAHRPGRTPAGPARSDDPLGPPAGAASARRLAVGGVA